MIVVNPVGYVRTARQGTEDDNWGGVESIVELRGSLSEECLDGIEEFSHAEIIFLFDQIDENSIVAGRRHPRNNPDWPKIGIFAQRASRRPNRLGATIVRILGREGARLRVQGLDAADGSPVLDIKPVMSEFLPREPVRQPEWSHELMRSYWHGADR